MVLIRNILILSAILPSLCVSAPAKTLYFAGFDWTVKSGKNIGPGPNSWDDANAWIDQDGYLHLVLTKRDNQWYCAEVSMMQRLGFGRYQFWVTGSIDHLDPNVVFGLFNYPPSDVGSDGTNEIDIEFARWGKSGAPIGNYTVWPVYKGLESAHYRFPAERSGDNTTQRFIWGPNSVRFQSLIGHTDDDTGQFAIWRYQPPDAASFIGDSPMPLEINLWLFKGRPPQNDQEIELVVRAFSFTPE